MSPLMTEQAVHHLPLAGLCYEFSRHNEPRIRVESGARLIVESEDAFSGQIRTEDDRRDKAKMPYSNPVNGPIYVEGARPGDSIAVTIHSIQPKLGKCFTRTAETRLLAEWLGPEAPHGTHVCDISGGVIHWSDKVKIPYQPMLGCIGTAPDWGVPTTGPAGIHGGNMDIVETGPGSTIYLPVFVEGAYLYLGDAHAAMGHGELSACGLEMPAETEITVTLRPGHKIPGPRIETPTEIMAIATGSPMERAIAQGYSWLILWMESEYGWDRWKAYDLLTHAGRISVGYYAIGTVGAAVRKDYL
jgi:acetamidase/formamidase